MKINLNMSKLQEIINISDRIARDSDLLIRNMAEISYKTGHVGVGGIDPLIFGLMAFVLACFVGYFVVWRVTPALHTPLMAVTNAVSGVIIVGAIIALGGAEFGTKVFWVSFVSIVIASVNIFGGFFVTYRMLNMFRK